MPSNKGYYIACLKLWLRSEVLVVILMFDFYRAQEWIPSIFYKLCCTARFNIINICFLPFPFDIINRMVLSLNIFSTPQSSIYFGSKVWHAWFLTMTGWQISNFALFLLIFWSVCSFSWCSLLRCLVWCFHNLWSSSSIIFPSLVPWYLLLLLRGVRHPSVGSHPNIWKSGDSVPLLLGNIL